LTQLSIEDRKIATAVFRNGFLYGVQEMLRHLDSEARYESGASFDAPKSTGQSRLWPGIDRMREIFEKHQKAISSEWDELFNWDGCVESFLGKHAEGVMDDE
jgi:hypothetical protein